MGGSEDTEEPENTRGGRSGPQGRKDAPTPRNAVPSYTAKCFRLVI
jgi:hypothetical protein